MNTNKKSDSKGVKKANESDVSGGSAHHPSALTHRSRRATPRLRKLCSGCLSEWQRAYKTVTMHVEVTHQDYPDISQQTDETDRLIAFDDSIQLGYSSPSQDHRTTVPARLLKAHPPIFSLPTSVPAPYPSPKD